MVRILTRLRRAFALLLALIAVGEARARDARFGTADHARLWTSAAPYSALCAAAALLHALVRVDDLLTACHAGLTELGALAADVFALQSPPPLICIADTLPPGLGCRPP